MKQISKTCKECASKDFLPEHMISGGMMGGYIHPGFPFYYINLKMLNYLGYQSQEEFVEDINGMINNCIYPDDRQMVEDAIKCQIAIDGTYQIAHRMRRRDGSYIWIHNTGRSTLSENGEPVIMSVCTDITEIKNSLYEKQLLLDEIDCNVFVVDEEYNLLYVNKAGIAYSTGGNNNYKKKKCYEYFWQKDKPCDFCQKDNALNQNDALEMYNTEKDRYFTIKTVSSVWNNKPVSIEYLTDVTKKHKAESQLKSLREAAMLKNEQFRVLMENTRLCTFEYNCADNKLTFKLNDESGRQTEQIIDNYMEVLSESEIIYPDDIEGYKACFKKAMEDVVSDVFEFRSKLFTRDYVWNRAFYTSVADENGIIYCILGRVDNIQDEKIAQQHYQAELAYSASLENQAISSIRVNLTKNTIEKVSDNTKIQGFDLTKNNFEYVLERHAAFLIDEKERDIFVKEFSRESLISAFQNGQTLITRDQRAVSREGRISWVRLSVNLIRNPESKDIVALILVHNIEKLKLDEAVMKKVIETEYDYIAYIDINTKNFIVYSINTKATDLPVSDGKDIEEAFLLMANKYVAVSDRASYKKKGKLKNLVGMLSKQPEYVIYFQTIKGNHKKMAYRYLDEEKTLIMLTRRDVTNTVETEEKMNQQLHKALKEARAANEAKDRFLANMSHDLRTPMNAILGLTELSFDLTNDSDIRDNLVKIQSSGKYLLRILNDILDMNKIDNQKMLMRPSPYRYNEFIRNITSVIKPLCDEKNITLEMNPMDNGPTILVDKTKFEQVFYNIFTNAVKYTPIGGHIEHYTILEKKDAKSVCFSCHIVDNGYGMSEEFLKHAFEPFSREVQSGYSNDQGAGLGLSISKSLIEAMGGSLEIKSKLGEGTHVIIRNELKIVDDELPILENDISYDEKKLEGLNILLIEDHPLNQTVAKKLLERKKIVVKLADNGKLGVEAFNDSLVGFYDAILMDIRMPVMDGLEAAKRIRSLKRDDAKTVKIIAMTANAFEEDRKTSSQAGMNAHLAKPIDAKTLYQTILSVCDSYKENAEGKAKQR